MDQLLIRYALPGLPTVIVLFVAVRFGQLQMFCSGTLDTALLLFVTVLLGNIVQQIWMLLFESKVFGMGYNSPSRRVLAKLKVKLGNDQNLSTDQLYVRWETSLYSSSFPEEIRAKDRNTWHFYHANCANALGLVFGVLVDLVYAFYLAMPNRIILIILGVAYLVFAFLLWHKAAQTRDMVEILEEHWVDEYILPGTSESSNGIHADTGAKRYVLYIEGTE